MLETFSNSYFLTSFTTWDVEAVKISKDTDGKKFIHQIIDEHEKNHTEHNSEHANEARIYQHPGMSNFLSLIEYISRRKLPNVTFVKIRVHLKIKQQ